MTKLFNMVAPDVAYFGQKDAQQAMVIKRLVRDLDIPVRIEVCPTVREPDGLAMSSRNARLSAGRARAGAGHPPRPARRPRGGSRRRAPWHRGARPALAELAAAGVEPEYFELVDTETLTPVEEIDGEVLAVVAARIGAIRLIDNDTIHDGRP